MAQVQINLDSKLLHELFLKDGKDEAFSKLMEMILNQILSHEASEQLCAEPYERNEGRVGYRNGIRERGLQTRIGTLTLSVPRFRGIKFNTSLFKRYQRSEQALILTMIDMVVNGVSTRKIKSITEELCGTSFSKSTVSSLCKLLDPEVQKFRNRPLEKHYPFLIVDAICTKVRKNGRIISMGILIVTGVNENGYREILGFNLADSESKASWDSLFKSLKYRGLQAVDLVVSDDHTGLVKSVQKNFQGTAWQRCQTHFSRNILAATPKPLQPEMKLWLHSLYNANNFEKANTNKEEMIDLFKETAPKAIKKLEQGFDDILAVLALPLKYRRRLRTTNSIERLNEEIRRRERVIRIFPKEASVIRL
ncbi:MAG TPA: IS256 family transposase, partial [Candidatus Cloacimonas sp.]|nr:IS256 family transposase [Candidatus Cloacimonas sp.]